MSSISNLKRPTAPKIQACLRRICKISDPISFPEPTCLMVSTKTQSPRLGADHKARGLWERDWIWSAKNRENSKQWCSPNWKPRIATVDSCFDLAGSRQHSVASYEVISWSTDIHIPAKCRWWWSQLKLRSKSLPIGQCHMQNARQETIGKIQNIIIIIIFIEETFS